MPPLSASSGQLIPVLTAVTTGNAIISIPPYLRYHAIVIRTSAGVSAGAVQLAFGSSAGFTGAFSNYQTPVTVPAANGETIINIGPMLLLALKVTVSTTVVGGTITVSYQGEK